MRTYLNRQNFAIPRAAADLPGPSHTRLQTAKAWFFKGLWCATGLIAVGLASAQTPARFADDILWRRSKLGLTMSGKDREALAAFMAAA